MDVLLIETVGAEKFQPITMTRFLWDITCGNFTFIERAARLFHKVYVDSYRFNESPYTYLKKELPGMIYQNQSFQLIINSQYIPVEKNSELNNSLGISSDGELLYLKSDKISGEDIDDFKMLRVDSLKKRYEAREIKDGIFINELSDLIKMNAKVVKSDTDNLLEKSRFIQTKDNVFVSRDAEIQEYVSLRADNGPVVIESGAKVKSFSVIEGPAYIGKNSVIDSAKVREGTTIREVCKIGGEIEESIVENFSNKHHEGFIGHSYLGAWVNIGAIATTSDLKNNYGQVRIQVGDKMIDTGTNKFGSVICDYSKIGIGMMLNTGTVVSPGCNLFQQYRNLPKYLPPFSWGMEKIYQIDRFVQDLEAVMKRRKQILSENKKIFLKELFLSYY